MGFTGAVPSKASAFCGIFVSRQRPAMFQGTVTPFEPQPLALVTRKRAPHSYNSLYKSYASPPLPFLFFSTLQIELRKGKSISIVPYQDFLFRALSRSAYRLYYLYKPEPATTQ